LVKTAGRIADLSKSAYTTYDNINKLTKALKAARAVT